VKALVYAETGGAIDTVLGDGRVVLERGRGTTGGEGRIYAQAQAAADRQRGQSAQAWALAERLAPFVAAACRGAVTTPLPIDRFAAGFASGGSGSAASRRSIAPARATWSTPSPRRPSRWARTSSSPWS